MARTRTDSEVERKKFQITVSCIERGTIEASTRLRTHTEECSPAEAAEHVLEWGGTGVRGHLTYKKKIMAPLGTPS